jgi:hypothetical protein
MARTEPENFGGSPLRSGRMLVRNREIEMRLEAARRQTRRRWLLRLGLTAIGLFVVLSLLAPGRAGAADCAGTACEALAAITIHDEMGRARG